MLIYGQDDILMLDNIIADTEKKCTYISVVPVYLLIFMIKSVVLNHIMQCNTMMIER